MKYIKYLVQKLHRKKERDMISFFFYIKIKDSGNTIPLLSYEIILLSNENKKKLTFVSFYEHLIQIFLIQNLLNV